MRYIPTMHMMHDSESMTFLTIPEFRFSGDFDFGFVHCPFGDDQYGTERKDHSDPRQNEQEYHLIVIR